MQTLKVQSGGEKASTEVPSCIYFGRRDRVSSVASASGLAADQNKSNRKDSNKTGVSTAII